LAGFGALGLAVTRIGLEAGPLSQWLYAAMCDAGLAVELLETRHVRNALKVMPVKTDRKDAQGIAELMRLGWFRPVHCKSMEAQETRAVLSTRKLVQKVLHEVEMSLRGVLRGFGLKVGQTTPTQFDAPPSARSCRSPTHPPSTIRHGSRHRKSSGRILG
jgi:transposase